MKKVLIIEDDLVIANIYRNKLAVEGFQVEIARDGQDGLDMVHSFNPDLVLLDLVLPTIPGLDVMRTIRAEPRWKQLPVIVFSNTYLTNMIQDAWKAGATKCLSKAICTPRQVIEVVRNSLKTNGAPAMSAGETSFFISTAKTPPVPAATVPSPEEPDGTTAEADAEFQMDLRQSFISGLPAALAELRTSLKGAVKAESEKARLKELHELYRCTHALTGNAALTGMTYVAQTSDALEALSKELYDNPKSINASTLRTVASAIDFLGILVERGYVPDKEYQPARALIVDDEDIAIKAISYALDKAKLKSHGMTDSVRAFDMALENKFDLIVLDVGMPRMDGFEFCSKLRSLANYKKTPVIFVTSLTDFETRANSTISGGNDLIAKPFLFIELATKAVVHVLRSRLEPAKN